MTEQPIKSVDPEIEPAGFLARTRGDCLRLLRLCRRRPLVPLIAGLGVLVAALLIWGAKDVYASVDGCVDREQGSRQAEQIQRHRVTAITLGDRRHAQIYAKEAERQEQWNREAERRCGQPDVSFELAMRRIDAKRDFLNLLAVTIFGFCTLASVLIAVALRDDGLDERTQRRSITDPPNTDGGGLRDTIVEQGADFLSSSASPITLEPVRAADAERSGSRARRWPIRMTFASGAILGATLWTMTGSGRRRC